MDSHAKKNPDFPGLFCQTVLIFPDFGLIFPDLWPDCPDFFNFLKTFTIKIIVHRLQLGNTRTCNLVRLQASTASETPSTCITPVRFLSSMYSLM